ncbi:hypothetical protein AB6A23_09770 [Paenibacillus tarimensis]
MKRNSVKWAVIGGVIVFMLLYGIEIATTGIESVYGPVGERRAAPVTELLPQDRYTERNNSETEPLNAGREEPVVARTPAAETDEYVYQTERLPGMYGESREPAVNRVAESTAGLLQSLSSNGIRFVVSLFESVTN